MKKIVWLFALAACIGMLPANGSAQEAQVREFEGSGKSEKPARDTPFHEVDEKEAPRMLIDAINNQYDGCWIKTLYVSNNSTYVKYKVVLVTRDGKAWKVYFDDRGTVLKEHPYCM